jgi:hypothetical protein
MYTQASSEYIRLLLCVVPIYKLLEDRMSNNLRINIKSSICDENVAVNMNVAGRWLPVVDMYREIMSEAFRQSTVKC